MEGIPVTKKKLLAFIRYQLSTSERWAMRALDVIYAQQEPDEKLFNQASHRNNCGFDKVDARILSVIAERRKRHISLSARDIVTIMTRMKKYSRQIFELSDRAKLESSYRQYVISNESTIENGNKQ